MIAVDEFTQQSSAKEMKVNMETEIRQLATSVEVPMEGKSTQVLFDDSRVKVMLIGFAAGSGLLEHVAPKDLMIQVVQGDMEIIVDDEKVIGSVGTWIRMPAFTPHSVQAKSTAILMLTLLK